MLHAWRVEEVTRRRSLRLIPFQRSHVLDRRVGIVPTVYFSSQEVKFVCQKILVDFDPPGLRTTVAPVRPTISPCFEVILHVERTVFGKQTSARSLGGPEQFSERLLSFRFLMVEDFQQREAIVNGAMANVGNSLPDRQGSRALCPRNPARSSRSQRPNTPRPCL